MNFLYNKNLTLWENNFGQVNVYVYFCTSLPLYFYLA